MKSLLVTGGAGFIGANFCQYWVNSHPKDKVVVLDLLTYAGNRTALDELEKRQNFHFIQGDILDQTLITSILVDHGVDTLVHFAAESHVDRSISGPDAFIRTNVNGTLSLLNACKDYWLDQGAHKASHLFHHVSTDEVYGSLDSQDPAFSESTPYAPNSPYSASKAASDHLVRAYHHTYGLNTTVSNCSNNYGPWQNREKLIPLVIDNILHGKKLPIYGDGKNIRDWLYVEDHCRAIDLIIERGRRGEAYNVGGENEWTNIDIVTLICQYIDKLFEDDASLSHIFPLCPAASGANSTELITFVRDRAGHDRRYAIDPSKCHRELDYHPAESFYSGIKKTLDWYIKELAH